MSLALASGAENPAPEGLSLWGQARQRLLRNRAATASLCMFVFIALASIVGPFLVPNSYDRVFSDYTRVGPSLAAHPTPGEARPLAEAIVARTRTDLISYRNDGSALHLVLASTRPVDQRLLVYFKRSDSFGEAKVVASEDEGRKIEVVVPLSRIYFPFGTDANGRDLLSRTLVAGRVSLAVGLLASGVALVIGVTFGAIAGYAGGTLDLVMMRLVDLLYALPFIFFVILLVVFFGRNFVLIFVAIGAVEWLDMARIVRGQTLSIKRLEYVAAAEALGVTTAGILKRHVIPNTLGPVAVYVTLLVPRVILLESFLSFLGLGVQEPLTSWGGLISDGARSIEGGTYLLVFPALFLVTTLFALNFIGDGLRDALDPRDR